MKELYYTYYQYGVLCSSQYFIVSLVLWLPHAVPGSWLINSLCAHAVFERSTDGGWHNLSRTSSDCLCGSLEQVCLGVGNSKTRKTITINNYLLKHNGVTMIYTIYYRKK